MTSYDRNAKHATQPPTRPAIDILGAGIGGLALAVALRRRDIEVTVHEQAPALEEVGAGLLLTPNAVAVLEAIGLGPAVAERGVVTPCWQILAPDGRVLQHVEPFPAGRRGLNIARSDLQQVLVSALPSEVIVLDRRAIALQFEDGEGAESSGPCVRVRFAPRAQGPGGPAPRDLVAPRLVAADGAHSVARALVAPRRTLRDRGYVGWRALVDHVPAAWADGRVSETWGAGMRFGIAVVGGERTYWYASANEPRDAAGAEPAEELARLRARFKDWHAPIADLLAATPAAALHRHRIADAHPGWRWTSGGRLALLGDAAHPLTPNLGQGAAMALEDAWELAASIDRAPSFARACRRYARRRRTRVALVWSLSRALGGVIQLEGAGEVGLRDRFVAATPEALSSAALKCLFHYRAK